MPNSVDPDYVPKSAVSAGFDAGEGILEDGRLVRGDTGKAGAGEKSVRRRLPLELLLDEGMAVDTPLNEF
jgi:hypothetical protein